MTTFRCSVALTLALAGSARADEKPENKLPDAVVKALEKADEVIVYSLDGEREPKGGWHGFKELGNTTVTDAAAKKALAAAVAKGVVETGRGAKCFNPHHGLRATYDGKTYDLSICYACSWVYVYTGASDKPRVFTTSDASRKVLDKILADAKVPTKPEK